MVCLFSFLLFVSLLSLARTVCTTNNISQKDDDSKKSGLPILTPQTNTPFSPNLLRDLLEMNITILPEYRREILSKFGLSKLPTNEGHVSTKNSLQNIPIKERKTKGLAEKHQLDMLSKNFAGLSVDTKSATENLPAEIHKPDKSYKFKGSSLAIQKYRFVQILGKGQSGAVYQAYDCENKRYVAMKRFKWDHSSAGIPRNVLREVSLLQQFEGEPNIVK